MKKNVILSLILIILIFTVYRLDRCLFFYGKSDFTDFHHPLPLDIIPYNFEYHEYNMGNLLVLLNKDYMTEIAPGSKYRGYDITVKEVLKYGYNENSLVALVTVLKGYEQYILIRINTDKSKIGRYERLVMNSSNNFPIDDYNWVDVKNEPNYLDKYEIIRDYLELLIIVIIIFMFFKFIRNVKRKK